MQQRGLKAPTPADRVGHGGGSSGTEPKTLAPTPTTISTIPADATATSSETQSIHSASTDSSTSDNDDAPPSPPEPEISTIEIPLSADNEFFQNLTAELTSLEAIQARAATTIEGEIVNIGHSVTACTAPTALSRRSDLYPWREIFRIYLEMSIFFSSLESERHQERSCDDAAARLQRFATQITALGLPKQFKSPHSRVLLARFLAMNDEVLRVLRFQAINKVAVRKILKKFDKRTALNTGSTFTVFVSSTPFLASHLAKAICYTMSSRLLTVIPQLDDYLCPVCQCISIKPVRLACAHVFCVRCLVKLQRECQDKCPMCRGAVVMKADATNLDLGLQNFLKSYFPVEAREKQKENEREVVLEQWQNVHVGGTAGGCVVM
ncbi:SPX domain-containing protein [Geopyxis carbonaria]|nr:SPX domain-containing protein [Geopyxis carbonaria]